jgi:hypothetical protein
VNSVPSRSIACMMIARRRARATLALRIVDRLAMAKAQSLSLSWPLFLLRHKFSCCERLPIGAAQHGHRESVPASATTNRLRIVAMEFGT